ncbi:MAG: NAD+ synthase [Candidatus Dadabacteria bacterium]|nr:MAG: NAD+ synthase [Candidatus Dadabacteria bacterium]
MKVALAQCNPLVGDLAGNADRAFRAWRQAVDLGADLVVLPELFLCGYPPEDLLLFDAFIDEAEAVLHDLARRIGEVPLLVGTVHRPGPDRLINAAALLRDGAIHAVVGKTCLPNYGPFDEKRYFEPSPPTAPIELNGLKIGVTICEDLWRDGPAVELLRNEDVDVVLNLSASPYHRRKYQQQRRPVFEGRAWECGAPVLVCNLVGGQDELVFDGQSFVVAPDGREVAHGPAFREAIVLVGVGSAVEQIGTYDLDGMQIDVNDELPAEQELADALGLALRDYVEKNRFPGILVGLSGGVDSALVAALGVRALGAERVRATSMPSRFNSAGTRSDARALAEGLGIAFDEVPIERVFETTLDVLRPYLGDEADWGTTAENMQARIRGQYLMALSNRYGLLVTATGNKSELAMGYATLYGDMVGGYALIKDLTKTWVYRVTDYLRVQEGMPIPETILTRPPSAELRENQTDQDSLPPYDFLDQVLELYIEHNRSPREIAQELGDIELVRHICRAVDRNEYKRRQAAPGPRVTERVFGKDRRMPITQRWISS